MKTLEQGSTALSTTLGNATALPVEVIHPLVSVALGFKVNESKPAIDFATLGTDYELGDYWHIGRLSFGRDETVSLFYNAALYVRVMFPFWIGVQIRWAGKDPYAKEFLQFGLGWKLNGRLAALFRIQSDVKSAAGVSGPNVGQAIGWEYGTK